MRKKKRKRLSRQSSVEDFTMKQKRELFKQFRKESKSTIQQILKERFEEVYDYMTLPRKYDDTIRDITVVYNQIDKRIKQTIQHHKAGITRVGLS